MLKLNLLKGHKGGDARKVRKQSELYYSACSSELVSTAVHHFRPILDDAFQHLTAQMLLKDERSVSASRSRTFVMPQYHLTLF